MASVCEICGKKPGFGMNVSHSHRRTKRRWNPNVQKVRAVVNGAPKRLHVCTSCIRAGKVTKPLRRNLEGVSSTLGQLRAGGGRGPALHAAQSVRSVCSERDRATTRRKPSGGGPSR